MVWPTHAGNAVAMHTTLCLGNYLQQEGAHTYNNKANNVDAPRPLHALIQICRLRARPKKRSTSNNAASSALLQWHG